MTRYRKHPSFSVDIQTLAESISSLAEVETASKLAHTLVLAEDSIERAKAEECTLAPMRPKRSLGGDKH